MTVFNRIGPFQVLRAIGQGGMAVVFLARDTRADRDVALKLVQPGMDREAIEVVDAERFGAELQKQFSQISPHVPAVYEYGTDPASGYFFVAMEYLDGINLSELLARGPLAVDRAIGIAIELSRFLEDAHRFEAVIDGRRLRSLLHLDLKPRNVRLTSADQVKVFDFGIAKALSLSRKVTRNDFGSIAYLSPERLETGEVDAGADFWALGVVLHEMVSGAPPFQAPDTRRLERLILARHPPPPLPDGCPTGLQAIGARLLSPTLEERYTSAQDIREDLERCKAGRTTAAEEAGWPGRCADEEATRRTRPAHTPGDADMTRQTPPAPAGSRAVIPPPLPIAAGGTAPGSGLVQAATARAPRRFARLRSFAIRAGLVLIALGILSNEMSIASEARRLANIVATRDFEGLPNAWAAYERLVSHSHLGYAPERLRLALVERTFSLAERVMANYRTPSPGVREAQWTAARDALARALATTPADRRLGAALRYCEGHLLRINGEAKKARRELDAAQQDLTEAVVAFREAAELRPGWPDPFVGLARTFLHGLDDVELGADAFNQALQHGHEPSDREYAQLADAYRARGDALVKDARHLAGLPQEREYLARAADAYRRALDLYSNASGLPNVPPGIRLAQRALADLEERLAPPLAPNPLVPAPFPELPADTDAPAPATPPDGSAVLRAAPWP